MWITFRCKGKDDLELICSCTAAAIVRPSESKWNGIRERGRKKWMKSNDTRMSCPLEWRPATMSHTPFSFVKNIYRVAQQNGLHGEIFPFDAGLYIYRSNQIGRSSADAGRRYNESSACGSSSSSTQITQATQVWWLLYKTRENIQQHPPKGFHPGLVWLSYIYL